MGGKVSKDVDVEGNFNDTAKEAIAEGAVEAIRAVNGAVVFINAINNGTETKTAGGDDSLGKGCAGGVDGVVFYIVKVEVVKGSAGPGGVGSLEIGGGAEESRGGGDSGDRHCGKGERYMFHCKHSSQSIYKLLLDPCILAEVVRFWIVGRASGFTGFRGSRGKVGDIFTNN